MTLAQTGFERKRKPTSHEGGEETFERAKKDYSGKGCGANMNLREPAGYLASNRMF